MQKRKECHTKCWNNTCVDKQEITLWKSSLKTFTRYGPSPKLDVTMCWLFKKSFETNLEICRKRKSPVSGKLFWKTGSQLNCFVNIDNAIVYLHIFEKHNDKRFLTFTMCKQIESWSFKNFYGLTAKTFFYIWNIEIGLSERHLKLLLKTGLNCNSQFSVSKVPSVKCLSEYILVKLK